MLKKLLVILLLLASYAQVDAAPRHAFDNLTIVVTSCDKYSSLWNGFFRQLYLYWPELKGDKQDIPLILIGNKKTYDDPRVTMVNIPNESSWSDNILTVIKHVKTDYILILLDDYYLTRFDENRLAEIYGYMRTHPNVAYTQIAYSGTPDFCTSEGDTGVSGLQYKTKHAPYRTSLQACIWKTEDLKFILKPGEGVWDIELAGSVRSEGMKGDFLTVVNNQPLDHLNVTQGGYVYDSTIRAAKSLKIDITSDLPLASDHKIYIWFRYTVLPFINHTFVIPVRKYFQ